MSAKFETSNWSIGGLNVKSITALVGLLLAVALSFAMFEANIPTPILLGLIAVVFVLVFWLLASAKLGFVGDTLVAGGGFYRIKIPLTRVLTDSIEVLPESSPFKLRWRTNGLGWPGLSLGWFTTNREKRVFAAITGNRNRIYIPLNENFDLVVSPTEPEKFLTELKSRTSRL